MTTTSQAQIEANRRNATRSTGPKTPEGKAVSRMNALKHSVLARQILVRDIDESSLEFKRFCAEYYEHLAPVGPLEQMLVDQIVAANWRLRRARIAETAEITLSVDNVQRRINESRSPDVQWRHWLCYEDPIFIMQKSADGNEFIERKLGEMRKTVEREGELTEAAIRELVDEFGGKPNVLTRNLETLRQELLKNPEGLDPAGLREKNLKTILHYLNQELAKSTNRFADCLENEFKLATTSKAAAVLPREQTLQKILRYESALEKQLFHAMDHLERLQRRRLGQKSASCPEASPIHA